MSFQIGTTIGAVITESAFKLKQWHLKFCFLFFQVVMQKMGFYTNG
jgi:hypothetical protein